MYSILNLSNRKMKTFQEEAGEAILDRIRTIPGWAELYRSVMYRDINDGDSASYAFFITVPYDLPMFTLDTNRPQFWTFYLAKIKGQVFPVLRVSRNRNGVFQDMINEGGEVPPIGPRDIPYNRIDWHTGWATDAAWQPMRPYTESFEPIDDPVAADRSGTPPVEFLGPVVA